MTFDPPTDCICHDTALILRHTLEHGEAPLCTVHQADEIAAIETARKVAADDARYRREDDLVHGAIDRLEARDQADRDLAASRQRDTDLAGLDPMFASVVRITNADVPLGLPATAYRSLDGFTEMSAADTRQMTRDAIAAATPPKPVGAVVRDLFDFTAPPERPTYNAHPTNPDHPGFVPDDAA